MGRENERQGLEIDEYLWPLTGSLWAVDWQLLTEELRVRQRLVDIMTHVRALHVRPRLMRLGERASADYVDAISQSIIAGPENGPPWMQTLKDPVPRALREEWRQLSQRLRDIARNGVRQPADRGPVRSR